MDKGKTMFLQYIPLAVTYLREAVEMFPRFTELNKIVEKISAMPMSLQG
jgi:aminoglycoside/choline kinase family phosphotransferase